MLKNNRIRQQENEALLIENTFTNIILIMSNSSFSSLSSSTSSQ